MTQILLFDFDGVIANTFQMSRDVKTQLGNTYTIEEFRSLYDGNFYEKEGGYQPEANQPFFDRYASHVLAIEPPEGMQDLIKSLARVYTLVIVSSTIEKPLESYLNKYDLSSCFDGIYGAEAHWSKIEKIKMVFRDYATDATHCLFITDTLGDIREASAVGVPSVGVTWGFHPRERLERGSPAAIVDTVDALAVSIRSLFPPQEK